MTTTMLHVPNSKWWIEIDNTTDGLVGTYNKTDIVANIQALKDTLAQFPNPPQDAADVQSILDWIAGNSWGATRKARVTALVNVMFQDYQGDPRNLEAAGLQAKLDVLTALRDRLV